MTDGLEEEIQKNQHQSNGLERNNNKKGSKSPSKKYATPNKQNEIEMQARRRSSLMGGTGMNCDDEEEDDGGIREEMKKGDPDSDLVSRNYGDTQGSIQFWSAF